jgi:tetraacyldisaccharide 4'-kinase
LAFVNKATIFFMSALKLLLLPFALVYDLVTRIRNRMYDTKWKPSVTFDLPVIGVGNLAVGGSGKTPMVEYLIRLLSASHRVTSLSRGYGRKTKGFMVADASANAVTVGDEPLQLFTKYGDEVTVAVCEDRAFAIPNLLDQFPDTQVIVMDDVFQHRRVNPGLSILLTEYSRPFYTDYVLPYGRLRERANSASRADVIVVTKCPVDLGEELMKKMNAQLALYTNKPVFFSRIQYGAPQPAMNHHQPLQNRVILVSGIANHTPLEDYVKMNFALLKHFVFRDHHRYTAGDLELIRKYVEKQQHPVSILTTEKDRVRLETLELQDHVGKLPIFYMPIEMTFIGNGKEFDSLVLEFVNRG